MPLEPPDWTAPWLAPYAAIGRALVAALAGGRPLAEALDRHPAAPCRFVPQAALPPGQAYESFVHATGRVPVRPDRHDFLNGLTWLHFPRAKARLYALHAAEIERLGRGPRRGPLRDALTLFDENGALLLASRSMWDALRARDWQGLFVARRGDWRQARLLVFGHGLLEQLYRPRKPLTAHVVAAPAALDSIADVDAWLAGAMDAAAWQAKPFAPLPVLGVPGWCAGNADPAFYDDPLVFRRAGRSDVPEQRTLPGAA
ncbi:DUF3025 domain-containing protein [Pseudorhodoferax sp.]|uniref:DUF3025 domain-containing protein n=1 Tax=Pseudorhodoferax sp. TaxID=1993553 RepID=UPI0039E62008